MAHTFDIAIIGGGILGVSIAYFLSANSNSKVVLVEQNNIASHTSTRNTGKVHAPFLYDPEKKLFARAAFLGFDMWKKYCGQKSLPFQQDGVLEVATYDKGIDRLYKYLKWGYANGLLENELKFLEKAEVSKMEPNVRCLSAIHCLKDGSVDYGAITRQLAEDVRDFGCKIMLNTKVKDVDHNNDHTTLHTGIGNIEADYIINAAGGNAVDIAHGMGAAKKYTDLHFRGEYWIAPEQYYDLTKISIYSVPKYPEYPFLDPHWIVRAGGSRQVGPNAVPVFTPYGYNWRENARFLIPKLFEIFGSGAKKIVVNKQFISLAVNEFKSSLSKTAMIERVREFLPLLDPSHFHQRGTAGIRSSLIGMDGKFVPDTMIFEQDNALHILNYNSPGATGALPVAAMTVNQLVQKGIVKADRNKAIWDLQSIASYMLP